ncbi:MAG: 3'-5' exonuclease [Nonlabens sp.]
MIKGLDINSILFLDIETVPQYEYFDELDSQQQSLFSDKTKYQRKDDFTPAEFYDRAGIWAEFGKIICISVGYFVEKEELEFRVMTFHGEERQLLLEFKKLVQDHFSQAAHKLCGHNGKEFDFPYIARRMIIHDIELPEKLNLFGKKPWEIAHLDTMELWKFGDYKHFTSLKLLTHVLGIASPKGDIDGSQVKDVFYKDNDLKRIITYCEADVVATAQIVLKLNNAALLQPHQILHR